MIGMYAFLWLLAGAVMLALEAFAVPGIGFFFAGLGALSVGALLGTGLVAEGSGILQLAWFCGFTALWAALLWKPIRRWRTKPGGGYRNMVGDRAEILSPGLKRGETGKARWSGTTMNARLDPACTTLQLDAGAIAAVVRVEGNVLILEDAGAGAPTDPAPDHAASSVTNR